ncbi:MAG TPA: 2,3-bisphosphoglycerate-independent phosphoglycerate mutase [Pseudomonadales bacterium]|nr:2,3-bisphosphoglycerate-independent phosphoglycerate mutase [Pseudomonadales bacterium]
MSDKKQTTALIILDGFGYREDTDANAIAHAHTPNFDRLWQQAPHTLISGSGLDVGLPDGQMGNSEVGHMSLGSGRIIYQSITRIDTEIASGAFFTNPVFTQAVDQAIAKDKAVHIFGLLSAGGVHSHESHINAAVDLAAQRGAKHIYVHAFLDGRDTPPRSAQGSLEKLQHHLDSVGVGRIASIIGRYYAMDRDNRWDRVEKAYQLIVNGVAEHHYPDAISALNAAYRRNENDEFVAATIVGDSAVTLQDGDTVLFMNFRADRARQLTQVFVDPSFDKFTRRPLALTDFVMTTEYSADLNASCAYPPEGIINSLGEYLEKLDKTQLRIAETEKYAHVTFFFSGGREAEYRGETRILVPSPDVATYDLKPEMSAFEVTDKLVEAIESGQYDLVVCNLANGDMVGHTGNFDAAVKAVEALDVCVGRIETALNNVHGNGLVTADHGNCEQMLDYESGQQHTQHTTELVPLIYLGKEAVKLDPAGGRLCDIAPTLLHMMHIEQPSEMTGRSLLG